MNYAITVAFGIAGAVILIAVTITAVRNILRQTKTAGKKGKKDE